MLFVWNNWFAQVGQVTAAAAKFLAGRYSLADAYKHQHLGLKFGGINPAALEATCDTSLQGPVSGAQMWTPTAWPQDVESRVLYHLNYLRSLSEILTRRLTEAKSILQERKLELLLVFKRSSKWWISYLTVVSLIRSNIANYFGIKWTDGKTYLLTWREQCKTPIDVRFLRAYKEKLAQRANPWFNFKIAVSQLSKFMATWNRRPIPGSRSYSRGGITAV